MEILNRNLIVTRNLNQVINQPTRQDNLDRNVTSLSITSNPATNKPASSFANVAFGDILDSRKTLEEKAASWKEAFPNGNASQLLSRNPKDIFLDKHVPQALKCPICFEIFASIVYQCEEGHCVCSVCFRQMTRCPLCQKRYGVKRMRNRLIEDLASSEGMSCPGFIYGCKFKGNIKSLGNHVSRCFGFIIGEKLAEECTNHGNSSGGDGSLLLSSGNENRRNQQNPVELETNYLNENEQAKFCFIVLMFAFFVKYWFGY